MHVQFGHSFGHADIKYSGHFSGAKQIKFMHIYMHKAVKGLKLEIFLSRVLFLHK